MLQQAALPADPRPATRFLTIEQALPRYSGLSETFIRRAIAGGTLAAIRDGRSWKIRRENLDQL